MQKHIETVDLNIDKRDILPTTFLSDYLRLKYDYR